MQSLRSVGRPPDHSGRLCNEVVLSSSDRTSMTSSVSCPRQIRSAGFQTCALSARLVSRCPFKSSRRNVGVSHFSRRAGAGRRSEITGGTTGNSFVQASARVTQLGPAYAAYAAMRRTYIGRPRVSPEPGSTVDPATRGRRDPFGPNPARDSRRPGWFICPLLVESGTGSWGPGNAPPAAGCSSLAMRLAAGAPRARCGSLCAVGFYGCFRVDVRRRWQGAGRVWCGSSKFDGCEGAVPACASVAWKLGLDRARAFRFRCG